MPRHIETRHKGGKKNAGRVRRALRYTNILGRLYSGLRFLEAYWASVRKVAPLCHPNTNVELVNLGIIGGVSYVAYDNWDQPHWDRKTVSAVTIGLLSLVTGEGYVLEITTRIIGGLISSSGSLQSSTKRKNTRRGGKRAQSTR